VTSHFIQEILRKTNIKLHPYGLETYTLTSCHSSKGHLG
jgi:hypothetical protein